MTRLLSVLRFLRLADSKGVSLPALGLLVVLVRLALWEPSWVDALLLAISGALFLERERGADEMELERLEVETLREGDKTLREQITELRTHFDRVNDRVVTIENRTRTPGSGR